MLTAELPPRVKGFTDEINILFAIDEDGNILGLTVISHRETPYYFRLVRSSGFFDKIKDRNFTQLSDIKAVTGASVSSKAVLQDMQSAANLAMKEIFGKPVPAEKTASLASIYFQPRMVALMVVLLLGLALRFFKFNRGSDGRFLRSVWV